MLMRVIIEGCRLGEMKCKDLEIHGKYWRAYQDGNKAEDISYSKKDEEISGKDMPLGLH